MGLALRHRRADLVGSAFGGGLGWVVQDAPAAGGMVNLKPIGFGARLGFDDPVNSEWDTIGVVGIFDIFGHTQLRTSFFGLRAEVASFCFIGVFLSRCTGKTPDFLRKVMAGVAGLEPGLTH